MGRTPIRERKREAAPAEATCRHHWLIETPRGSLSKGRCKLCGEERQFRNSATDYVWDDDSSSTGYGSWRGLGPTPSVADDDELTAAPESPSGEPALAL